MATLTIPSAGYVPEKFIAKSCTTMGCSSLTATATTSTPSRPTSLSLKVMNQSIETPILRNCKWINKKLPENADCSLPFYNRDERNDPSNIPGNSVDQEEC
jgi:hypothetical protein